MSADNNDIDRLPGGPYPSPPEGWQPEHVTRDIEAGIDAVIRARIYATSRAHSCTSRRAAELVLADLRAERPRAPAHDEAREVDRQAGWLLRSWSRAEGDIDVTVRDGVVALRPKSWRLALALRMSLLEAEREREEDRAHAFLMAVGKESHARKVAEREAAELTRERDRARDEISEAKERLAKLTGAVFVHGPTLAQHIERIEAWAQCEQVVIGAATFRRTHPTTERSVRASCAECGSWHDCPLPIRMVGADRTSVVVDEDDGDPA